MGNQLQLTQKILNDAPSLKAMFELDAVKHHSILNYTKTSGVSEQDAALKYERERVLFMKAMIANPDLEKCDRFSIYSAWIELHADGGSLADGEGYLIPRRGKGEAMTCSYQPGWKNRYKRISMMPGVKFVSQAQVVYSGEEFEYELGAIPRLISHKPKKERGKSPSDVITHAYFVVEESAHLRFFIMERHQVIAIRDVRSEKFKYWRSRGGKTIVEDGGFVHAKYEGGKDIALPFWLVSYDGGKTGVDNPDAFKKTIVNKTYNEMPNKTPRLKALDKEFENRIDSEEEPESVINYGINKLDTSTGEVIDTTHTEEKPEIPTIDTEAF